MNKEKVTVENETQANTTDDGMGNLIRRIAKELRDDISEPDNWGSYTLPLDYLMSFDFTSCGVLKLDYKNTILNEVKFSLLEKGNWITVEKLEQEIIKVFKGVVFTKEQLESRGLL
jgi:hypothetical protein